MNPGPDCSGCTGTICVGSNPIICTQCQRLLHGHCNGLTRDQQKSPQVYACGSTNGSTIQPSQITRSQPNNAFFCQTNIAVSNHPCSRLPQQISIPLQRRSTDHPNTEPTTPAEHPRATTVRKCPECNRCLAQVRSPLVCVACRQQFHVKCVRKTPLALQRLRAADAWTCYLCASVQRATNQPAAVDRKTDMPEQNKHRLTILQWNCDYLTTKVVKLSELTVRYGIDIIALQETNLGRDDPTPVLNGFDAVRRDRPGSGARFALGGGLLTYIKKGIPYSEVPAAQQGLVEKLHVTIPTTRRQHLTIANVYFPPASSNYVQPMEDRQTWVDTLEARGPSDICGDFNDHHVSWDEYAQGMPRGAVLNDGKPTRAARFQQGCGLSAPDITIVNSEAADRFSWQPLNELSSDHSPILIKWNQLVKTERAQRRVRSNFRKADWNLFRARLAEYQPLLEAVTDPATKLKTFVDCLQKAAAIAVPQKVCRKKETPWMNADLKTLIQERNRLRWDMGANRDAWVAKTREVLEKTKEAKRNTWRAHLEEVTQTKDAKKAWAVVKSLNGSARAQDGKILVYKGRKYVSYKAKTSAFIQEYASVSGRKSDRSSRRAVRELRSSVRRLLGSPRQELEQPLPLKTAKAGKAGGPDGVAPDLLKHLSLNTQKELLFILNAKLTTGWSPQAWRTATIVPFLKKEKDPQAVSSYRPIALTSTIGKLLERLIVNRLSWWLEAKSLLSPRQAGFRKRRCTTDQCLRLSQFVNDGLQSTNKERTVLMLFDYSKAYDTVWRTGLLQKMLDIGVPLRFVQWTTAWLTNRIARVQLNGVTGRCRTFKEGLPHGSVLLPLLFVLYINDLLWNFSESTMVSAYADDLALACRGRKKEDVALRMQAEVDRVVSWSQQARLTLNAAKCEVAFFSLDNAEAQWRPQITINGVPPSCTPSPTFLGVTYDRRMTFGTQVKKVCQQMLRRTNLLRVVGGTTWCWQKQDFRTVYIATQRSVAEYAAAAWTPWLSSYNIEKPERTQLQAARAITHHVRSTPTEAVLYEADLPRLEHRFKTLRVLQANKWNSLDVEDPRRVVLNDSVRLQLRRPDWRTTVLAALSSMGLLTYHPGDHSPPRHDPPWSRPPPAPTAMTDVSKSISRDQQLAATLAAIEDTGPTDIHVYTDGSTHEGITDGGAWMVVMSGEDIIERWHAPTGRWSSSYQAEKSAMVRAISWLDEYEDWQSALVLCDSKSLV